MLEDNIAHQIYLGDLVNSVKLTQRDYAYFNKHGFLKIEALLRESAVEALRNVTERKIVSASSIDATYGDTFSKLSYGLADNEIFKLIYTSRQFKRIIGDLVNTRIIATECNGFELVPGSTGFPWHYGSLSFRYIRPEDMAWSIWFPLDPIDPTEQGGGMAYVSQDIASCAIHYQLSSILSKLKNNQKDFTEITSALNALFGFEGKFTSDIFENFAIEENFNVGDAFIFNKNVWHRSAPLLEGHLKRRLAVNMRFVDWRSKLDMERYHGEAETGGGLGLGVDFGSQKQTSYGSHFTDIEDGDELRDSKYCGEII